MSHPRATRREFVGACLTTTGLGRSAFGANATPATDARRHDQRLCSARPPPTDQCRRNSDQPWRLPHAVGSQSGDGGGEL